MISTIQEILQVGQVSQITPEHIAVMRSLIADDKRFETYQYYKQLVGDQDSLATSQIVMQQKITTYSGLEGGAALVGNLHAKVNAGPDLYNISLDEFSKDIVIGLIDKIEYEISASGGSNAGLLTRDQIQAADQGVWAAKGMLEWFPGNVQVSLDIFDDRYDIFTDVVQDIDNAATALIGGAALGKRESEFSDALYDTIIADNHVMKVNRISGEVEGIFPNSSILRPIDALSNPVGSISSIINSVLDFAISGADLLSSEISPYLRLRIEAEEFMGANGRGQQDSIFDPMVATEQGSIERQESMNEVQDAIDIIRGDVNIATGRIDNFFYAYDASIEKLIFANIDPEYEKQLDSFAQFTEELIEGVEGIESDLELTTVVEVDTSNGEVIEYNVVDGDANKLLNDSGVELVESLQTIASSTGAKTIVPIDATTEINDTTYGISDILSDAADAAEELGEFISDRVEHFSEGLFSNQNLNSAFNAFFAGNAQALIEGDLSAADALKLFAFEIAEQQLTATVLDSLLTDELSGAYQAFKGAETSEQAKAALANISALEAEDFFADVFTELGVSNPNLLVAELSDALTNLAVNLAFNSNGWNSEQYTQAGVQALSVAVVKYALTGELGFAPAADGTTAVITAISTLINGGSIDDAALAAGTGYVSTYAGTVIAGEIAGSTLGVAVGEALGFTIGQVANFLAPVIGVLIGVVVGKVISSFVGGKEYRAGEFPSAQALLDAQYQVVQIDDGFGGTKDALAAVNPLGATVIVRDAIDTVIGGSGQDSLIGGAADNTIFGNDGADYIEGGAGEDNLFGGAGNDHVDGGAGNDIIDTGEGNDYIDGGTGDDTIIAGSEQDIVYAGEGNDAVNAGAGDDIVFAGAGNDVVVGGDGDDHIEAGAGDDVVQAGEGDDIAIGGAGDDQLSGGGGDDILDGGEGSDEIHGDAGNDLITGGDGIDLLYGETGNDIIDGEDGDDFINGGIGHDVLYGGANNDSLVGGVGDDVLDGGEGNDDITAGFGNDIIIGNTGDDSLSGGEGDDLYLFLKGDGTNVITDESGADAIAITDEDYANIVFTKDGDDLKISYGTDDEILVKAHFANQSVERLLLANGVVVSLVSTDVNDPLAFSVNNNDEQLELQNITQKFQSIQGQIADQTSVISIAHESTWTAQNFHTTYNGDIDTVQYNAIDVSVYKKARGKAGGHYTVYGEYRDPTLEGAPDINPLGNFLPSNDAIIGSWWAETINGFGGDDYLVGNGGNDTINGGDGNDAIHGGEGNDTINGGQGNDLVMGGTGNDLIDGNGDNNTIYGNLGDDIIKAESGDDFVDGGYGNDQIEAGEGNDTVRGGAGDDYILGGLDRDLIAGGGGSDTIFGDVGVVDGSEGDDDAIFGNDGNDNIYGEAGDDYIHGGDGDDYINGGIGSNFIDGGNGLDIISYSYEQSALTLDVSLGKIATSSGTDTFINVEGFEGGAGDDLIYGDENDNIFMASAGDDFYDGRGGNDILDFRNYYSNTSVAINLVTGTASSSLSNITFTNIEGLKGTDFQDSLVGDENDNVFIASAGNDVIDGGAGFDTLDYSGISASHSIWLQLNAINSNLGVSQNVQGIERVYSGQGNSTFRGQNGDVDEEFYGNVGNDTLYVSNGNDFFDGGEGVDTIHFGQSAVAITTGINVNLDTGVVSYNDSTLRIENVENTRGSTWNELTFYGSDADEFVEGGRVDDELYGGAGNDVLSAGHGTNLIYAGAGDDRIIGYLAHDYIDGGDGVDVVDFYKNSANGVMGLSSLNLNLQEGTGYVTYPGWYGLHEYVNIENVFGVSGINNITGNDGDNELRGQGHHDTLRGLGGNDTLIGGAGNDTIEGGDGDDYIDGGAGHDTIDGGAGDDILISGGGVGSLDGGAGDDVLKVSSFEGGNFGDSYRITTFDGGDGFDIIDFSLTPFVANFSFNSGSYNFNYGTRSYKFLNFEGVKGTNSNEVFYGDELDNSYWAQAGNDTFYARGGDDLVYGGSGNDLLLGGLGDDTIFGDEGNDSLYGEGGVDTLNGGAGDDTLHYSADAQKAATPYSPYTPQVVQIGPSLPSTDYALTHDIFNGGSGYDKLVMTGGNDSINLYDNGVIRLIDIEEINAGSGDDLIDLTSYWYDYGDIKVLGGSGNDTIKTSAGNDYIDGEAGIDVIRGGGGDDTIYGGSNGDTLDGGAGDDTLDGGTGDDTIFGSYGEDVASGGDGDDTIYGGDGNDTLEGDAGADGIRGGWGNDIISGGDGDDTLWGHDGDDTITGGNGNDVIYGGDGEDTFVFSSLADSTISEQDLIVDFSQGSDLIDLSALSYDSLSDFDISFDGQFTIVANNEDSFSFKLSGDYDLNNSDFNFA